MGSMKAVETMPPPKKKKKKKPSEEEEEKERQQREAEEAAAREAARKPSRTTRRELPESAGTGIHKVGRLGMNNQKFKLYEPKGRIDPSIVIGFSLGWQ